jgi:hypothetical protein
LADRVRHLRTLRKLDFVDDVLPLLLADMEYAYYEAYLKEQRDPVEALMFGSRFVQADAAQRKALIERYIPVDARFNWNRLVAPIPQPVLSDRGTFASWLDGYLREDIAQARLGNLDSPVKAASDVLRDLRDNLRAAIDFGGLTEPSHRWLLSEFVPIMNRVAVGPPEARIAEMLALIEAGLLRADWGPGAGCKVGEPGVPMRLTSAHWPDQTCEVHALIRARVSMHGPTEDASPLLADLLQAGHIRPFRNGGFHPGGIEIDRHFNWVARDGGVIDNAWALGIPTEGVKFYTFVVPRPGVNSTALVDAGVAVSRMLNAVIAANVGPPAPPASPLPTEEYASAFASLHGAL